MIGTALVTLPAEKLIREAAGTIEKYAGPDLPPPGAGLVTVIVAVPCAAMSAAVIAAVNLALLTNVVVRALPFQFTTDPAVKFPPKTLSVKAAPAGAAAVGEVCTSSGKGLFPCALDFIGEATVTSAKANAITKNRYRASMIPLSNIFLCGIESPSITYCSWIMRNINFP